MNILMTSGGRRVAMRRAFEKALSDLDIDGQVIVADLSPLSSAFQDAPVGELVPRCTTPQYIDALLEICTRQKIDLLVPFIDTELPMLASARDRFPDVGTVAVVSGPETVGIAHDKAKTAAFFTSADVLTPQVLSIDKARAGDYGFPLFIKPNHGSSSIGSRAIRDVDELNYWLPRTRDPVLLEYVEGIEYTVDVYTGLDGAVHCAVPRRRLQTRAGEVSKGLTDYVPEVIEPSLRAARALSDVRGVITFQCILGKDGGARFFDINARLGGGAPLSINAGADFLRWTIEEAQGQQPSISDPPFRSNVLMLRYDDAVFLERDEPWV